VNTNLAWLLLMLAGGLGGTAVVQTALSRPGGRRRRPPGALFHYNG
jgi:hypothetical protein